MKKKFTILIIAIAFLAGGWQLFANGPPSSAPGLSRPTLTLILGAAYDTEAELDALFALYLPLTGGGAFDAGAGGFTVGADGAVTAKSVVTNSIDAPTLGLYDSDADGADKADEYAGGIDANMTDTTEDAEISDVTINYMKAGTKTAGITISGTDGSVSALVKTTVGSGSISQTAQNEYIICTNTCSVTPLTAAAGQQLCVRNGPGSATVITLVNRASQYYELTDHSAWATANQKLVSGGVATDSICIVGYDATHYATMNYVGTWTDTVGD